MKRGFKKEFKFVFTCFVTWRAVLYVFLFFAIRFLPLQKNFLGGGMANYLSAPWFWAWSNFDGEHYLAIAQHGYGFAEQAFFPLYPLLIRIFGGKTLLNLNIAGFLISNSAFLLALVGFYKLVCLDFSEKVSRLSVIILLIFPTSFYFGSVYTESLFLTLVVWSFYFARKGNWLSASVLGMMASATRTIGIGLLPVLLIEYLYQRQILKTSSGKAIWLLLIPIGLLAYMYYLHTANGDWLAFLHSLPSFGEQRSATPIFLPQVYYRYIFKILPNLNYSYFPIVFTTLMEFIVGVIFLLIAAISFFKLRLSYALFLTGSFLAPTLSGSFSSLPRYVLVSFPAFIILSVCLIKLPKILQFTVCIMLFLSLVVAASMFVRGFWIA
jgi:hypothetical protein